MYCSQASARPVPPQSVTSGDWLSQRTLPLAPRFCWTKFPKNHEIWNEVSEIFSEICSEIYPEIFWQVEKSSPQKFTRIFPSEISNLNQIKFYQKFHNTPKDPVILTSRTKDSAESKFTTTSWLKNSKSLYLEIRAQWFPNPNVSLEHLDTKIQVDLPGNQCTMIPKY